MPFPLNQQICTACITVTQLVHSKTASKLEAPIKNKVTHTQAQRDQVEMKSVLLQLLDLNHGSLPIPSYYISETNRYYLTFLTILVKNPYKRSMTFDGGNFTWGDSLFEIGKVGDLLQERQ